MSNLNSLLTNVRKTMLETLTVIDSYTMDEIEKLRTNEKGRRGYLEKVFTKASNCMDYINSYLTTPNDDDQDRGPEKKYYYIDDVIKVMGDAAFDLDDGTYDVQCRQDANAVTDDVIKKAEALHRLLRDNKEDEDKILFMSAFVDSIKRVREHSIEWKNKNQAKADKIPEGKVSTNAIAPTHDTTTEQTDDATAEEIASSKLRIPELNAQSSKLINPELNALKDACISYRLYLLEVDKKKPLGQTRVNQKFIVVDSICQVLNSTREEREKIAEIERIYTSGGRDILNSRRDKPAMTFLKVLLTVLTLGTLSPLLWKVKGRELTTQIGSLFPPKQEPKKADESTKNQSQFQQNVKK